MTDRTRVIRNTAVGLLSALLLVLLLVGSPLPFWTSSSGSSESSAPPGIEQLEAEVEVDGRGAAAPPSIGVKTDPTAERRELAPPAGGEAAPRSLRGTVVDERGEPIADVTVFLAHPEDSPGFGSIEEFFENHDTMESWSSAAPASTGLGRVCRTDDEGRFEFKVAAEEKRRLVVWHPAWQVKFVDEAPRAGANLVIELQRHVRITGDVIEAGTGRRLEGISLALFREGRPQPIVTIRSSAAGEFEFPRVPAGSYRLTAYGDGFRSRHEQVGQRLDDHRLIELAPVEPFELTLVDAEGAAWTGERWSAQGFDAAVIDFATTTFRPRSRMDLGVDTTTSRLVFDPSTGKVAGGARPAGTRSLSAWVGENLIAVTEVPVAAESALLAPVLPGAARTFTVVVRRDPTLATGPCRGELFTRGFVGSRHPIASASAVDGVLAFSVPWQLEAVDAFVEVTGGEREAPCLAACQIPATGNSSLQIRLSARAGTLIVLVREGTRGRPGADVWVIGADGHPVNRHGGGRTGPDGAVSLVGLPVGPVRIVVDADGASGVADCTLPTDQVEIDLQAKQSRSVEGPPAIDSGVGVCLRALDEHGRTLFDDRLSGRTRYGSPHPVSIPVGTTQLEAYRPGHAAPLAVAAVGTADPIRL